SVGISAPVSGTTVRAGSVVIFTGAATDPEDGDLGAAIVWTSNLDGHVGTGRSLAISTLRPGTHVVTAAVTDSAGGTASASVTIAVNALPTVGITGPVS